MQANRRRDTAPEMAIRRLVHASGLRYRVDARPLPTARHTADMIFTRARVAVFIDGCWWHGCAEHYRPPASNTTYWAGKVARNRERDRLANEALIAAGWTVIRVWEHEAPESAARRIEPQSATLRQSAASADHAEPERRPRAHQSVWRPGRDSSGRIERALSGRRSADPPCPITWRAGVLLR